MQGEQNKERHEFNDFNQSENRLHVRILAAGALVLELVLDVITVTASDHGQLRVGHCGLASIQLPEVSMPVPHTVNQPGCSVTHLMDQRVPEAI